MSEFKCPVVRLGQIEKHPNADTLGITKIYDYPCIVKLGEFQSGDLVAYIPVDAVVPTQDLRFAFLKDHPRIKARKLRGYFSMGLIIKAEPDWKEGDDVTQVLGIKKYESPQPLSTGGDNELDPGHMPTYTDIEGLRRWPDVLKDGEEVVVLEKIHGANARYLHHEGRLWVGSHNGIKKESEESVWWRAARQYKLADKLAEYPGIAVYGEVYGYVQDLRYGAQKGQVSMICFDALDIKTRTYLDWMDFVDLMKRLDLPVVPIIHQGGWDKSKVQEWSNGKSLMPFVDHIREGFVVKPVKFRYDPQISRVILKRHGEDYLTRKEG
jgi:RNA ligase (TIGR02306 family)